MIKKMILKTLAVMAVLLSLTAVPALAEIESGRFVSVNFHDHSLETLDLQTAESGGFYYPRHLTRFAPTGEYPTLTPDGQTLVYTQAGGHSELYSLPLDQSVAPTKLTTKDPNYQYAYQTFPAVSPDGNTVYFQYTVRDESSENILVNDIYSVPIEGGNITQVTDDNRAHDGLKITPDGENFVYRSGETVYVEPLSGGPATPLYDDRPVVGYPALSPDGTRVAFFVDDDEGDAIYTVPFSTTGGGAPTKVSGSELTSRVGLDPSVVFSPDGQSLAYSLQFDVPGECSFSCGEQFPLDGIAAETRVIPVGGGNYSTIHWGEHKAQTQIVWAPASSDTTAPQLGPLPDITLEATGPNGARWFGLSPEDGPKDDVDPNPSLTCLTNSSGSFVPAVGRNFRLDTPTLVTCTAEDATGKRTSDSFDVTVRDTSAPAITGMPSDKVVEATGANGAQVSWNQPTATDLVSGSRTVNCAPASGATFALGTTTVSCTATDTRNNTATKTFKVTVEDTTAPDISGVPSDMSVTATRSSGIGVHYSLPTATDLVDGNVKVQCTPASGTTFVLGTTTVSCTATDAAGKTGKASFFVHVLYDWSGVLQPINADGSSIFKLGTVVPVKFSLSGDSATITDATAKLTFTKVNSGIEGTVLESTSTSTATTGDLFRYDAAKKQYVFNWGTKSLTTGAGTYELTIDLGDGMANDAQSKNHVLVSLKR